ncbi:hypothetical protein I4F81_002337 [Pyropia yezoensis]|uniref:Uncharacterized protein n=1 Tax=Pyropia yezoensis TaxID=2788 RepID=A0ACC3BQ76_PYRYE|nr:hypothetical protein I4F81_002337 [Neopyropia yezoensis]
MEGGNSCEQAAVEATRRAASEALDSLGQVPTYEEAVANSALKRDLFRNASAASSQATLSSSSSDMQTTMYEVLSTKEEVAKADYVASQNVVLLNDAKRCPQLHLKLDIQATASRIRDRLDDVSRLEAKVRRLTDDVRRLRATRPPQHSPRAAGVADAVFVTEPRKASDQVASKSCGKVGPSTLQCMCFDPTSDGRVWRALVPDRPLAMAEADAAQPRLMAGVMFKTSMKGAPETSRSSCVGVENAFGTLLDGLYRADSEVVYKQRSILQLKLPVIQASESSTPDNVGGFDLRANDFVPLRVREYKGSSFSCLEALPQALATGSCVAVGLLQRGLRAEDVIVPVDVATGKNVQFGAIFIAGGCIPMSIVTSKELDLSDLEDARLADLHYIKMRSHVQELMQLVREARAVSVPAVDVSTVPDTLYCKRNCVSYQALDTLDNSIWHMMRVLSHLYRVGPRECICFPMGFCAVRRAHSPSANTMDMIFPNLAKADPPYHLFVPADWATANLFVDECDRVVSRLHAARVVHGDLYVSNIAWRQGSDKIDVKIMDWDTSFFMDEHSANHLPESLRRVWQDTNKWKGRFSVTGEAQELDLFMIRVMRWGVHDNSSHAQGWKWWLAAANANSVGVANAAFRSLQELYLAECKSSELQGLAPASGALS